MSSYFWRGHGLNLVSQSKQAQREQFGVGAAEMGARIITFVFEIWLLQNAHFAHSLRELTKKKE